MNDEEPNRCRKTPRCQLRKGHDGGCGGHRALLRAVWRKQSGRVIDYLATKAIKLLGGAS